MSKLKSSHKLIAVIVVFTLICASYFVFHNPDDIHGQKLSAWKSRTTQKEEQLEEHQLSNSTTEQIQSTLRTTNSAQFEIPQNAVELPAKLGANEIATSKLQLPVESNSADENHLKESEVNSGSTKKELESSSEQTQSLSDTTSTFISTTTTTTTTTTTSKPQLENGESSIWRQFQVDFSKSYPDEVEMSKRKSIFFDNLNYINKFNSESGAQFKLAVNQFADMTREEINHIFVGPQTNWSDTLRHLSSPIPPKMELVMDQQVGQRQTVDWRSLIGAANNQGACKESSVMALLANIESVVNAAEKNVEPIRLSVRQALDCMNVLNPQLAHCAGSSSIHQIYKLLQSVPNGLVDESSYKQHQERFAHGPSCVLDDQEGGRRVKLGAHVEVNGANFLDALENVPLTVALDASQSTFHFYSSGLYSDANCSADSYNLHALLVGFSPSSNSEPASFVVRNSFGPNWGENGHIRIVKDQDGSNKCLPQVFAIYPSLMM